VPETVRTNDDPVFDPLRAAIATGAAGIVDEVALFTGLRERRVLAAGERIEPLMAEASRRALAAAGVAASAIDRLYGYATPSEYLTPNALYLVHQLLGLERRAAVFPINCEFSNFIAGVVLAWEAILAKRCNVALAVAGSALSRGADYALPHAVSVGDGAGAAVVGPSERLVILDSIFETQSDDFDTMTLAARPHPERVDAFTRPTYLITEGGRRAFLERGMTTPPRLVNELLARHGVASENVTLVTHQASRRLLQAWTDGVRPREHVDTFEELGNMTLASIPVTLSKCAAAMSTDYIACASAGTGANFSALLLRR
jgi:3-oxoacyl-[acyl-carrier-protein] synthase-3